MVIRRLLVCLIPPLVSFSLNAQVLSGDAAVAEKYVRQAERALAENKWSEARIILERGADYSDVSSDISYLLALARSRFDQPQGAILESLERAIRADRWHTYSAEDALLLEAESYLRLRKYSETLGILSSLPESPRAAGIRLKALRFAPRPDEFRRYMADALDRYPRNPEPARIFFEYLKFEYPKTEKAAGLNPRREDQRILDLILHRLPALLLADAGLAWMAASFIRDTEEARRLVEAYRTVNKPDLWSLPAAVDLGAVEEGIVLEELFSFDSLYFSASGIPEDPIPGLDKTLLEEIGALLRDDALKVFRRNLSEWSGVIREDSDRDGFAEAAGVYRNGMLEGYSFDADQDGLAELVLDFEAGDPRAAFIPVMPESGEGKPYYPARDGDRRKITLRWERYPAVLEAELGDERFLPRPLSFYYNPVRFREIPGTSLLFPEADPAAMALTRRTLVANAFRAERPSREFPGGTETVELNQGIPVRAREYLEGRMVSETDFLQGRPLVQRADLDTDGRMETIRRFRRAVTPVLPDDVPDIEYAESDWDGDGWFESPEPFR
ncbi:MAG: hypothetical protein LBS48_04775 [Treponema sp.]|jgi:hypothetical protein|nr:hypothetical protein [Treponema sp.]